LKRLSTNHRTAAPNVTAELSIHLKDPVTTKQSDNSFTNPTSNSTAAMAELLITENDTLRRKIVCDDHKTWTSYDWRYITWSDESSILFPTSG
jgi:hypothetical protein